jgi:signal peptidase I
MSASRTMDSLPRPERIVDFPARGRQLVWSILVPAALTAIQFRYLVPTRLSGATGGVTRTIAQYSSDNPLIVILALFIVTSAAIHYWRQRAWGPAAPSRPLTWTRARFGAVLLGTVLTALFLRTFVAEIYRVTSPSMLPDVSVGDRLLVVKSAYGIKIPGMTHRLGEALPKRGDVIVFQGDAATGGRTALVKRVMGLPGDTIVFSGGQPLVNGWPVPSCDAGPYVSLTQNGRVRGRLAVEFLDNHAYLTVQDLARGTFQYTVQKGEVFVVGDDRGMSHDSRAWNEGRGGGVRAADIVGRVSRVLVGGRADGSLDFSALFAPMGLALRQSGLDLTKTKEWIAGCLKDAPPSVPPAKQVFKL